MSVCTFAKQCVRQDMLLMLWYTNPMRHTHHYIMCDVITSRWIQKFSFFTLPACCLVQCVPIHFVSTRVGADCTGIHTWVQNLAVLDRVANCNPAQTGVLSHITCRVSIMGKERIIEVVLCHWIYYFCLLLSDHTGWLAVPARSIKRRWAHAGGNARSTCYNNLLLRRPRTTFTRDWTIVVRVLTFSLSLSASSIVFLSHSFLHGRHRRRRRPRFCNKLWFSPIVGFRVPKLISPSSPFLPSLTLISNAIAVPRRRRVLRKGITSMEQLYGLRFS